MSKSRYLGLRGTLLNLAIAIVAGLDFLLFGYDQGVMGGLLTLGSFTKTFPEIDLTKKGVEGISIASYNVGCFCGAIGCIWIGNMLGRRKTIFLGSTIMIIGATLQTTAFSLSHFIVGRTITGMGNGLNTSTVPTWQSECSKSHRRGQMVMMEGAMISGGIALSYWIDFAFSFLDPSSVSWRFPIAFQNFFAIVIAVFVLQLPESPRWLVLKGREEEALGVLSALHDMSIDDQYLLNEFASIKETVLEMARGSFRDLFVRNEDRHLHRVILAYVNQMFQQICGINLITYYAPTIYETEIGLSPFLSRILAACNGTEYFFASFIPIIIIERVGRRPLMLIGAAGMSFSMIWLAISSSFGGDKWGIVAAAFLFVFNTFYALGWLGMSWLYPAEILPLRIRAPGNAISTSANWAFNFLVVMITPVAFDSIRYRTYIIFAVINAFIVPVIYFFYPETKYRSLEEMDAIFRKCRSVFSVVSIARNEPRRYGRHGELLVEDKNAKDQDTSNQTAPTTTEIEEK
ncbi:hypothetical protein VTN00DRAFT_9460 [Thermoascus crustaceus]|uniref:uncharacterized protein n=1 Tax=Thermoascus crustaceus TaxID=5088 RepID=UPI003744A543